MEATIVHVPIKLESGTKSRIKLSYNKALDSMGFHEQNYIYESLEDLINLLRKSPTRWKTYVAKNASLLLSVYKNYFELFYHQCTGCFDLDDSRCLECGEDERRRDTYDLCRRRSEEWNKLCDRKNNILKTKEIRKSILASLFYLCNPYDVIPDFTPGIGFADDAYVLNLCIRKLKRTFPNVVDSI